MQQHFLEPRLVKQKHCSTFGPTNGPWGKKTADKGGLGCLKGSGLYVLYAKSLPPEAT